VSADLSSGAVAGATGAVRVQVVFHTSGERQAQTVAAMLIDRAHEIANLPECECDVDVSVETSPHGSSPAPVGIGGAPPSARPSRS
jgi:hypothetical protein